MDKEVAPVVFAVVENKRLSAHRLGATELVEKMGVRGARSQQFEYAWRATGDRIIATIWAEFVHVHTSGRWFYIESLDTRHRLGGGDRGEEQKQRAERRLALLKRAYDNGQSFRAVLQTSQVPIAELERNAKVAIRVRDDEEWHVADWRTPLGYAVLVRGLSGWAPSAAEVTTALATGHASGAVEPPPGPAAAPLSAAESSSEASGGDAADDPSKEAAAPHLVFPDHQGGKGGEAGESSEKTPATTAS